MIAIALLRGINVGGKIPLPMASLRALCEGLGWRDPATYIQSGNVVFRADARRLATGAIALGDAIQKAHGFRPGVVVRTLDEMRRTVAANPFAGRRGADGARLLVMFLAEEPTAAARRAMAAIRSDPEEVVLVGRGAYLSFPNGVAESNLPMALIEKTLGVAGTTRNWNTLLKLVEMGEAIESSDATATRPSARRRTPSPD